MSPSADKEWMSALLKIRRRDPSIYDTSTHLFPNDADAAPIRSKASADEPKHKSKTLRQILYEQVRAAAPRRRQCKSRSFVLLPRHEPVWAKRSHCLRALQAVDEEADVGEGDTELDRKRRLREDHAATFAYDAEQQELRSSLLSKVHGGAAHSGGAATANDSSDDEDGLTLKTRAEPAQPASVRACYAALRPAVFVSRRCTWLTSRARPGNLTCPAGLFCRRPAVATSKPSCASSFAPMRARPAAAAAPRSCRHS